MKNDIIKAEKKSKNAFMQEFKEIRKLIQDQENDKKDLVHFVGNFNEILISLNKHDDQDSYFISAADHLKNLINCDIVYIFGIN